MLTLPPLVCTLTRVDYATRLAWIVALNRASLRSHRRDGVARYLVYTVAAASQVHELVRHEQAHCAFLRFDVSEGLDVVAVRVEVPVSDGDASDLLAPFFGRDCAVKVRTDACALRAVAVLVCRQRALVPSRVHAEANAAVGMIPAQQRRPSLTESIVVQRRVEERHIDRR